MILNVSFGAHTVYNEGSGSGICQLNYGLLSLYSSPLLVVCSPWDVFDLVLLFEVARFGITFLVYSNVFLLCVVICCIHGVGPAPSTLSTSPVTVS